MRLGCLPAPLVLILSSFCTLSCSLPLAEHRSPRGGPLAPRATYSVVPIDGGGGGSSTGGSPSGSGSEPGAESVSSGSGPGNQPPVTVVEATQTVYRPEPPQTQHVTATVVVTPSPSILVVTKTSISIVDISGPTAAPAAPTAARETTPSSPILSTPLSSLTLSEVYLTAFASSPSSLPSSATAAPTINPVSEQTYSTSTGLPSTLSGSASPALDSPTISTFTTPYLSSVTTFSSSTTYDNGMWHTTYPPWNGTFAHRFARAR